MKKLTTERNLKKERLSGLFLTVLVLMVVALSVTRVVIANRLVESSEKLRSLDQEITKARDLNRNLAQGQRLPQSLSQIAQRAKDLGFAKTNQVVFLGVGDSVALRR